MKTLCVILFLLKTVSRKTGVSGRAKLSLVSVFAREDNESVRYKNHLIAKALLAVLYSNETAKEKKNEIFRIIEVCHTNDFNFDATVQGLGYTRNFSECFEIDSNGNFGESVLINELVSL